MLSHHHPSSYESATDSRDLPLTVSGFAESVNRPLVVVVDDAPHIAKGLAKVLEAKGFRSHVIATAAETQAWLESHAASANPHPAALLIDVHLPDGSGIELAREARRLFGDSVPVVVLSGDTSIETLRALPEANATMFVAKPVHIPQLIVQIQAWAANHR